jgi:recombination protein RecA
MPEAIEAEAAAADSEKGSAASKPKDKVLAPKPKDKKKDQPEDVSDRILAKIKACAPRKDSKGMVEITQTSKAILSRIKYVLTTGIQPFDDLIGGFPMGRITEIYGLESCGKTQLAVRAAVRGQARNICEVVRDKQGVSKLVPLSKKKIYVHVLYVDNEQSIDSDEKIVVDGVEMDVHLARCDTIDQLFKMADISISEVAVAQKEDKETLYLVVIVADTITATSCNEEMEQAWGKQDYSRLPKQLKEGFRRLTRKINRVNVAMICTNQVGDNMKASQQKGKKMGGGGLNADDFTTSGGRALKFFASHRVFMRQIREYKTNPKSKFANGILIGFRSMKNRVKKPFREGRMVLLFGDENGEGGGLNNEFSILETLIYFKYIEIGEGEKKEIKFKFHKHGIKTTTFEDAQTSTTLDEDDSQPAATATEVSSRRGKKDPFIGIRAEWPAFYAAHKADIDALYQAAIHQAFAQEHVPGEDDEEIVEDEEFEEEEV